MFLLIPDALKEFQIRLGEFKFHYVSINSYPMKTPFWHKKHLNSIMFLLIQPCMYLVLYRNTNLNSIMFLLIQTEDGVKYLDNAI